MKFNPYIPLVGALISLIALLPFPVEFYTFTRITISLCSAYAAFGFYKEDHNVWIVFALVTVLYNPILPIYLYDRSLWQVLNVLTALVFSYSYSLRPEKNLYIFLYFGKFILIGGLLFWMIVTYTIYDMYFNDLRFIKNTWHDVLTIILFIIPFGLSKLWNYFFLNDSRFWINSLDKDLS